VIDPEELRRLFLFTDLTDEQLAWVADHAEGFEVPAGEVVLAAGAASQHFVVLLEGELVISALVGGEDQRAVASDQPGVFAGGLDMFDTSVPISAHAGRDSRLLRFTREALYDMLWRGFPGVGYHLVLGMEGARQALSAVSQQEKLASLGKLSAGLAHELNNPAAAARSSAQRLRTALTALREAARVAGDVDAGLLERLRPTGPPRTQDPLARADLEDALADGLAARGIDDPGLAADLADVGFDPHMLREISDDTVARTLRVVAAEATADALAGEILDATERMVDLVQAMKAFTSRDQAPVRDVDVNEGIDSTITLLGHRIQPGVAVERDLAPELPTLRGRAAELNQVWANLLDNALDAVGGEGWVVIRTRHTDGEIVVEVADSGSGIPEELAERIFDPFVTGKDVGEGTGLGLDIARRIVRSHRGTLTLEPDRPDTTFRVTLPITAV
jgi:signal transduction histidine kinase